jgi:hypothetical protein
MVSSLIVREDRTLTAIWGLAAILALVVFGLWAFVSGRYLILIGATLPLGIFVSIYLLMSGLKQRILGQLRRSFGENTMQIATAIMDYFEVPMTILISVAITLFVFAAIVLIVIYGIWEAWAAAGVAAR